MTLRNADLAILSARFGVARAGASRFGFYPDDVEGVGADEPGEYVWKEDKPPTTLWTLQSLFSFCGERPVAAFTDLPDPSYEGAAVTFTDASTPSEYISFWYWSFGDGNYSYDQNPTHTYTTAGEYTVTLYVAGIRGSASATGTHTVQAYVGPTASFTNEEPVGFVIAFTDTSTEGDGTIDTWLWNFGDETTSSEQSPTHDFGESDTWTVTLTVTDTNEQSDSYQKVVFT